MELKLNLFYPYNLQKCSQIFHFAFILFTILLLFYFFTFEQRTTLAMAIYNESQLIKRKYNESKKKCILIYRFFCRFSIQFILNVFFLVGFVNILLIFFYSLFLHFFLFLYAWKRFQIFLIVILLHWNHCLQIYVTVWIPMRVFVWNVLPFLLFLVFHFSHSA